MTARACPRCSSPMPEGMEFMIGVERLCGDCYEAALDNPALIVLDEALSDDGAAAAVAQWHDAAPDRPTADSACTGASGCRVAVHFHGCYADRGSCDEPEAHRRIGYGGRAPAPERPIADDLAARLRDWAADLSHRDAELLVAAADFIDRVAREDRPLVSMMETLVRTAEERDRLRERLRGASKGEGETTAPSPFIGEGDENHCGIYCALPRAEREVQFLLDQSASLADKLHAAEQERDAWKVRAETYRATDARLRYLGDALAAARNCEHWESCDKCDAAMDAALAEWDEATR